MNTQQIKEDFYKEFGCDQCYLRGGDGGEYYADWWLKVLDQELDKQREGIRKNIGMLRQWLNEDRITDKKMVTNEEIEVFLSLKEINSQTK